MAKKRSPNKAQKRSPNKTAAARTEINVYCEGETEIHYFELFKPELLLRNQQLNVRKIGRISKKEVDRQLGKRESTAKRAGRTTNPTPDPSAAKEKASYIKASVAAAHWFFFDHDGNPETVDPAVDELNKRPDSYARYVCFNTCIETWFLFHFTSNPVAANGRCEEDVLPELNKPNRLKGYTKNQAAQKKLLPQLMHKLGAARKNLSLKAADLKFTSPTYETEPHKCCPFAAHMLEFLAKVADLAKIEAQYPPR